MTPEIEINALLEHLSSWCPKGYTIAAHMGMAHPKYLFRTYPEEWIKIYSEQGYVIKDPLVAWSLSNTSTICWSEIDGAAESRVMTHAAEFGLTYGIAHSIYREGARSICAAARDDRPFTNSETAMIAAIFDRIHVLTGTGHELAAEKLSNISPRLVQLN